MWLYGERFMPPNDRLNLREHALKNLHLSIHAPRVRVSVESLVSKPKLFQHYLNFKNITLLILIS